MHPVRANGHITCKIQILQDFKAGTARGRNAEKKQGGRYGTARRGDGPMEYIVTVLVLKKRKESWNRDENRI